MYYSKSALENADRIVLIKGDLSGIQDFIYNITSSQASKNLKGRSFYINLLSKSILVYLYEKLGIHEQHTIYATAGNFLLAVPATKFKEETFKEADNI